MARNGRLPSVDPIVPICVGDPRRLKLTNSVVDSSFLFVLLKLMMKPIHHEDDLSSKEEEPGAPPTLPRTVRAEDRFHPKYHSGGATVGCKTKSAATMSTEMPAQDGAKHKHNRKVSMDAVEHRIRDGSKRSDLPFFPCLPSALPSTLRREAVAAVAVGAAAASDAGRQYANIKGEDNGGNKDDDDNDDDDDDVYMTTSDFNASVPAYMSFESEATTLCSGLRSTSEGGTGKSLSGVEEQARPDKGEETPESDATSTTYSSPLGARIPMVSNVSLKRRNTNRMVDDDRVPSDVEVTHNDLEKLVQTYPSFDSGDDQDFDGASSRRNQGEGGLRQREGDGGQREEFAFARRLPRKTQLSSFTPRTLFNSDSR